MRLSERGARIADMLLSLHLTNRLLKTPIENLRYLSPHTQSTKLYIIYLHIIKMITTITMTREIDTNYSTF